MQLKAVVFAVHRRLKAIRKAVLIALFFENPLHPSPDVIAIPPLAPAGATPDSELPEFDKIEFPDPKIVNENHLMVSECFGLSSDSLVSSDTDD
ncbi:hypothetical protein LXL04_026445 [Taraxacum kok-saghyz]